MEEKIRIMMKIKIKIVTDQMIVRKNKLIIVIIHIVKCKKIKRIKMKFRRRENR